MDKTKFPYLDMSSKMCNQNLSISLYNGVCGSYVQIDFKSIAKKTKKEFLRIKIIFWRIGVFLIIFGVLTGCMSLGCI